MLQKLKIAVMLAAGAAILSCSAFALDGEVTASALKVREQNSTESSCLGKVGQGDILDVVGRVDDWYIIDYDGSDAFVYGEYVELADVAIQATLGQITGSTVNVREGPSTDNSVVGRLLGDTVVNVIDLENGWYKIKYVDLVGYVSADYVSMDGVILSHDEVDMTLPTLLTDAAASETLSIRQQVINYAYGFLGIPYVYGGSTPDGFDCSGFTQYVFKNFGYSLSRSSSDQINDGTSISKDELKPGDLVFFSHGSRSVGHVGIYVGDGNFIHSTSTGDVIRVTALSNSYYAARYVGGVRIIND